jgi:naphthalene 1,2-dioxygenase system ferredoxin subunit
MSENWTRVAAENEVEEEGTRLVRLGEEAVCLYRFGGRVYATHDRCTHGLASLADGFIDGENIECPLHQGLFHIPTGKAVGLPCKIDLKVYAVKVEAGEIFIADAH